MKKISDVCKKMFASAAKCAVNANVNSSCNYVAYQPKVPAAAKKLRKF